MPPPAARPEYRHAVVKQAVYSAAEALAAVHRDPVVKAHYSGLALSNLRLVSSPGKRLYASYRKDDRVYWTAKPVAVPEGEAILTDGTGLVRARCGNRLSETAQLPVAPAAEAATEDELDQTTASALADVTVPTPLDAPREGYAALSGAGGSPVETPRGGARSTSPVMPSAGGDQLGQNGAPYYANNRGFGLPPNEAQGSSVPPVPSGSTGGTGQPLVILPVFPGIDTRSASAPLTNFVSQAPGNSDVPVNSPGGPNSGSRSTAQSPGSSEPKPPTSPPTIAEPLKYPEPSEPSNPNVPTEETPREDTPLTFITETPEPSTVLLIGTGLAVALAYRRRKLS
ncbi:MAG TPA: PEP-CTERM sorting domain-containing protein [Bryobacteraceae bacterium]|nr:PEP-CTERM sorting domain-containing protein [Bryobacteraceae bacterium]